MQLDGYPEFVQARHHHESCYCALGGLGPNPALPPENRVPEGGTAHPLRLSLSQEVERKAPPRAVGGRTAAGRAQRREATRPKPQSWWQSWTFLGPKEAEPRVRGDVACSVGAWWGDLTGCRPRATYVHSSTDALEPGGSRVSWGPEAGNFLLRPQPGWPHHSPNV